MPIRLNIGLLRKTAAAHGDKTDTLIAARTRISAATISTLSKPDSKREPKVATFHALGQPYDLTVDQLILADDEDAEPEPVAA